MPKCPARRPVRAPQRGPVAAPELPGSPTSGTPTFPPRSLSVLMTDSVAPSLCRVTVRTPERIIDLAVPADVPVADLLHTVVEHAGETVAENGLEHGGWVLQRLGGPPLPEERSLESLGVLDGEALHLRPRSDALPEVVLDDLVDGVADTMEDQPFGWTAEAARRLLVGMLLITLAGGLGVLLHPPADGVNALAAGVVGLALLGGAAAASRAVGDAGAGAALGVAAVAYIGLAGWLLPGGELGGEYHAEVLGARALAFGAAALGAAMLAVASVAAFASLFLGMAVVATGAAIGGALMMTTDLAVGEVAAVLALISVICGALVPSLSFRLSGLKMPPLPTNAKQLQEGITPHSPSKVERRTVLADGWMTGLYGAIAVLCSACLFGLALRPTLAQVLMMVALSLLLLLHARALGNTLQRLSVVTPGLLGAGLLAFGLATTTSPSGRLLLTAGLLAVAAALAIASWTVPGRRLVPYWGRAGELLQSAAAISMLPLTLWVLGVYGALRAING